MLNNSPKCPIPKAELHGGVQTPRIGKSKHSPANHHLLLEEKLLPGVQKNSRAHQRRHGLLIYS
jgi:hypothetical protein